jgi:PAS domain S-box-containing protein
MNHIAFAPVVPSSRTHLLNVNDDASNRHAITEILRSAGFDVTEAHSGVDALRLVQDRPALVILGVQLPDMSGFDVCREIKSNPLTASTIVLHTSASFISSDVRVEGLESGADGYLVQPMEPPELIATVRALLRAHRAEGRALRAAGQWQATFDAISDGVCLLDEDGHILQTNAAFNQLTGETSERLRGQSFALVIEDVAPRHPPIPLNESRRTRTRATQEISAGERSFRLTVDPILDETHGLANFVCILTDISERKRADEAVRLSEARFRRIANTHVIGVIFSTPDGRITDANDAFLEISGRGRAEIESGSLTVQSLTPEEHLPRTVAALNELEEHAYFSAFEKELIRKDGRRIPVLVAGSFVDVSKESIVTFVLDVTQRKTLEAELRRRVALLAEADRRKDEFLAMLAHELRNPLSAILTSLYLQDRVGAQDERNVKLRATVTRQAKHLARLVDDLLEVSRVTRGKIHLKKERIDLAAAVRHAIATSRTELEKRQQVLEIAVVSDELTVDADSTRLEQIVINLLGNAAKYSDTGGRITVSLARDPHESGDWARLSIRDEGIGIPQEMLPHIFELFVQVDQSLARAQGGLGIGLTMVKNLVEMHGGTVAAFSEGPGKGSEFVVRLPRVRSERHDLADEPSRASDSISIDRAIADVVVIEDNADARETISYLLDLHGMKVRAASDGAKGLGLIQERRPDAALIDIGMTGLNGYEVAQEIRKLQGGERIHLVALTGYGSPEDRERSARAGFDLHLVKPVDARELLKILGGLGVPREG